MWPCPCESTAMVAFPSDEAHSRFTQARVRVGLLDAVEAVWPLWMVPSGVSMMQASHHATL